MHDTSAAGRLLPPLFLILACLPGFVLAQHNEPDFETLSLDQGAPTIVQCILQDRTGYLWFATWSGLYRYYGYSFVSYKHELDDTTSLFDNTLTVLYEDKAGVLWVGSYLGLDRFDRGSETFVHYTPNPSDTGSNKSNQVRAICEDTKGVLWVGTGNGVYKFDRATEEFTSLRHDSSDPGSISHSAVNAILEDKGGSLWFRTDRGLDRLDHATGKFIHHWKDPNKPQLENLEYWFGSMYEDEGGVIWLGTRRGLLEYYPKEGTFFTYLFIPKDPINHITSISQDVLSGRLWLATRDGLFSFDKKSKAFTHYDTEANYVCSERSGTIWIGTKTEIRKLNRAQQPFTKYATKETICAILNGPEGILWMFYDPFGWLKFDTRKEQFIPYSFGEDWLFYVWIPVPDISIRLKEGGLYIQDTLGNITFSLDSSWESYLYEASYAIKTRRGYWCGFDSGDLDFWEPGTNRVRKVRNFKQRIYWMYEDRFDQLWIATLMGKLFCFKPEKDSVIDFTSETTHLSKTTAGRINQIYEDKKGRLWFATTTGLNRLERSTGHFVQFTERDGLRSNNICGILEDDHGLLLCSMKMTGLPKRTALFKSPFASAGLDGATMTKPGF